MIYKLYNLQNQFIKETKMCPPNFTGIVEWADGSKTWSVDGKLHRLDGPAIEHSDGTKEWRINGKRHRLDGPAIEWANGSKFWFIDNEEVSEEQCKLLHSIMKLKGIS